MIPFSETFVLQFEVPDSSFQTIVQGGSEEWDEMSWKIKFNPVRIRNHAVTAIVFAVLKVFLLVAICILGMEYINCANYILFLAQSQNGEYFQPYDDVLEVCDTLPWFGGTEMLGIIVACSVVIDCIICLVIFCDEVVEIKRKRLHFADGTPVLDREGNHLWNVPEKRH